MLAALPELSLQIIEFAREHGRVTSSNRNTLKQHFLSFVERGHLSQQGSGREGWYELK